MYSIRRERRRLDGLGVAVSEEFTDSQGIGQSLTRKKYAFRGIALERTLG